MNVLILDDDPHRHAYFHEVHKGDDVTHCYSYTQFLTALPKCVWDLIYLDHDLGDHQKGDTYKDGWGKTQYFTGAHASIRVCELPSEGYPKKVIVQSVNFDGKNNIIHNLKRVGIDVVWEPFGESPIDFSRA